MPLPNPISASEIYAVTPEYGIDPEYFLRVTSEAEAVYIGEASKAAEKAVAKASKKAGRKR